MKKIIAIVVAVVVVIGAVLAFVFLKPDNEDDGKTKIYVELKSGGTGVQWLIDAGARFSDAHEDTVYEEGKKGVVIVPVPVDDVSLKNAPTSGTAIYDVMGMVNIENEARAGNVLCIDEVMNDKSDLRQGQPISPLEKISESQRSRYMYDGHYYAGPSCEYYPVICYDRNLFDNYFLYFVNPDEASDPDNEGIIVAFESEILNQTYHFLPQEKGNDAMKSCGPDGEYGTNDDGLPSSLYELIALCEYMSSKGISPFNFTGNYKYYSNFMLSAIYTALQGYEGARNNYEFSGESEIVVGLSDEYLFPGVDGNNNPLSPVRKPITKKVTITEENGYYTTWEVEKYYAEAFMDLCVRRAWFGPSVTNGDDQKAAMSKFVFSDFNGSPKIAMHIDGSYWYNEATEGDNYFQALEDSKYLVAGMTEERDVRIMPLPVNYSESVVEGEGKTQALLDMNYGMFVINKNVEENPGLMQASIDFLKFLYTDAELSAYTASTSITRSMDYSLLSDDQSKISSYGELLLSEISSGRTQIVYFAGENKTFKANTASFKQSWDCPVFAVPTVSTNFYEAIAIIKKDGYKTVEDIFAKQSVSKSKWSGMYQGGSEITDVDGLEDLLQLL